MKKSVVPAWLNKMWKNHYGEEKSANLVNFFTENTELADVNPFSGALSIIKDNYSDLFVYVGNQTRHFIETEQFVSNFSYLNIATSNIFDYRKLKEALGDRISTNIFETKYPYDMSANISNSQDIVFAALDSPLFDESIKDFSKFAEFDTETFDKVIENDKMILEKTSSFVRGGGYFVIISKALNKKENKNLMDEFVKNYPNFVLKFEKQYYPDEHNFALYYSILRKVSND